MYLKKIFYGRLQLYIIYKNKNKKEMNKRYVWYIDENIHT